MTVSFWLYIDVDLNASGWLFTLADGTLANYLVLVLGADGTQLLIFSSAGFSAGVALTVGRWYHVALTKSGNTHTLYLDGVSVDTLTVALSFTTVFFLVGSNGTDYLNGRMEAMKLWTAALTAAEIAAEQWQTIPTRGANVYAWWPLLEASDITDKSGNGNTFTAGGALATAVGPGLRWGGMTLNGGFRGG